MDLPVIMKLNMFYCTDALARTPLWNVGLNYQHGTGHGVGSFLNVHEGPCRFDFIFIMWILICVVNLLPSYIIRLLIFNLILISHVTFSVYLTPSYTSIARISAGNRISPHEMGLEKGMVLSDEPGYYEKGAFGIR